MKKLWLYKTTENDNDGEPLDFGVVRACTEIDARAAIDTRLLAIFELRNMRFKLYELHDHGQDGVIG